MVSPAERIKKKMGAQAPLSPEPPIAQTGGEASSRIRQGLIERQQPPTTEGGWFSDIGKGMDFINPFGGTEGLQDPFQMSRSGAIMTGTIAGARIGSSIPGPPQMRVLGAGAGGILGSIAGTLSPEAALALAKFSGVPIPAEVKGLTSGQLGSRVFEEALIEIAFLGLGALKEPVGVAKDALFRSMASVGPQSRVFAQMAKRQFNIDLDIVRLADPGKAGGKGVKAFSAVIGIFPFIRKPLVTAAERGQEQTVRAFDTLVQRMGPVVEKAQRGIVINRAVRLTYSKFIENVNKNYDQYKELATKFDVRINPNNSRKTARRMRQEFQDAQVLVRERHGPVLAKVEDPIRGLLEDFSKLANGQTVKQLDVGFLQRIDNEIGRNIKDKITVGRLMELKEAARLDLHKNAVGEGAREVVDALQRADIFFNKHIKIFETATARKFGRIDKNIFRAKFSSAGTREQDELFDILIKDTTPQGMRHLRDLLGPQTFKAMFANRLGDALEEATTLLISNSGVVKGFDLDLSKLQSAMGLLSGQKTSLRRGAINMGLKLSGGVKLSEFEDFFKVAEKALSETPADLGKFLLRRGSIGGARGAIRAMIPAAQITRTKGRSVIGSFGSAILFTLGFKRLAKIISDPKKLRVAKMSMDERTVDAVKRANLLQLAKFIIQDDDFQEEEKTVFRELIIALTGGKLPPLSAPQPPSSTPLEVGAP
jgi:hypothetical protein